MEKSRPWLGGAPITLTTELFMADAASAAMCFGRKLLAPTLIAGAAVAFASSAEAAKPVPVQASFIFNRRATRSSALFF